MRTHALLGLALLSACTAETGFQNKAQDNATSEGAGKLELYPSELVWTDLEIGVVESQFLKITSAGEEPLRVYDITVVSSDEGQFSIEAVDEFELEPGQVREFSVQCALSAAEQAVGELRIRNTDPDQNDLRMTLTASPAGGGDTGGGGETGDSGAQ